MKINNSETSNKNEKKKNLKLNKKNIIIIIITIILVCTLLYSLANIFNWFKDNNELNNEIVNIEENVDVQEVSDNEKTEIINNKIKKDDLYWKYIKMNLINVDFKELKNTNPDTVGWIQVNGTNINYPFVQTNNNDYYLEHSFYKKDNHAGWVFLDYRNNIKDLDKNTILYAHSRVNGTMFGTLKNILTNGWLNNTDNYVVKLSTENENTLWQVFSVYPITTTNDYIKVKFNNNKEFEEFANMLISRSQHNFNTNITKDDKILTLSTCYSDTEKLVLHAKLIKKEVRK